MDFGRIIERIKNVLLTPAIEWPAIAADAAPARSIYQGHVLVLAGLAAISGLVLSLIFGSLFGQFLPGFRSIILFTTLFNLLMTFVAVWAVSLIAKMFAPNFGGVGDELQALKTVAYSWTAAWVGAILAVVPVLGWLTALAGSIYSIYLFYVGCEHTMKVPKQQAAGYTAVVVLSAILLMVVIGYISSSFAARFLVSSLLGG